MWEKDTGAAARRRAAYLRYAQAAACLEQGGDLLPEARRLGREALALLEGLPPCRATGEDLEREIHSLLKLAGEAEAGQRDGSSAPPRG